MPVISRPNSFEELLVVSGDMYARAHTHTCNMHVM